MKRSIPFSLGAMMFGIWSSGCSGDAAGPAAAPAPGGGERASEDERGEPAVQRTTKPSASFRVSLDGPARPDPGVSFELQAELVSSIAHPAVELRLTLPAGSSLDGGAAVQSVAASPDAPAQVTWLVSVPDGGSYTFVVHAVRGREAAADEITVGAPTAKPAPGRVLRTRDGFPVME